MEAPLHQLPVPLPQDALLQQAVAAGSLMMAAAAGNKAPGREQCPRCASRDTKFCYYNNYNTAQPRHFCRACRRYWTLGGSLRNVPVGGSTRKRPRRPARHPTRAGAMAAAVAATAATPTATTASSVCSPFASPAPLQGAAGGGGLLHSSLLLGSASASASATPLLALGAAPLPLLEARLGLGFDIGLGEAAAAALAAGGGGGAAGDLARYHHQLLLGAGPLLPWPAATSATILEGDSAETTAWKATTYTSNVFPFPPAGALWQELAAAGPAVEAGAGGLHLHHGGASHLLL